MAIAENIDMPSFTFSSARVRTRIDVVFNVMDAITEQRINERLDQINRLLGECAADINVSHTILKRFS